MMLLVDERVLALPMGWDIVKFDRPSCSQAMRSCQGTHLSLLQLRSTLSTIMNIVERTIEKKTQGTCPRVGG